MKPHEAWLIKSLSDLKSAKKLINGDEPILDTAIYHTQQCAEKALKGYLAYCNQPIMKTHDLIALNDKCVNINSEFEYLYDLIESVNQNDTIFRYPSDDFLIEPSKEDVDCSIENAQKVYEFIIRKLE